MKNKNLIKETIEGQKNPILKFRVKQRIVRKNGKTQNEKNTKKNDNILLRTLITETREQIDSSENC